MKEATGEANMTVVTIILIGVIVAIATPIVNNMMTQAQNKANCMNAGGYCDKDSCVDSDGKPIGSQTCGSAKQAATATKPA